MPTKREREYYSMGYQDALKYFSKRDSMDYTRDPYGEAFPISARMDKAKPKRKLSPWNKFVKANSKKPRFRLRSGSPNLKKLAVAFRKTPAGRKKKRR